MVYKKPAYELQKRLVQCCIDFINETKNPNIDRVTFSVDCLQASAKCGSWQPCTDSSCKIESWDDTDGYDTYDFFNVK